MAQRYRVKGQWMKTATGRVYEVKTVGKARRIVVAIKIDVPVDVGFDLAMFYGNKLSENMIEQAANDLADRFGKAAS